MTDSKKPPELGGFLPLEEEEAAVVFDPRREQKRPKAYLQPVSPSPSYACGVS
jgi:hypothetical protein